jgi:bacterial/archaeal transporter family protein
MKTWVIFALISMVFAGMTAVVAKMGLSGISSELGIVIRTCFVFLFVLGFAAFVVPREQFSGLTLNNYLWLGLSGATTAVSWIFYYKALKDGDVSTVALIDKGSVVIALVLAWIILKEGITPRVGLGIILMLAGLLVISKK